MNGTEVKQKKEGLSEFYLLGPELNYAYVTVKEKDINSIQKLTEYLSNFAEDFPDTGTSHLVLGRLENDEGNILDTALESIEDSDGAKVDFIKIKNKNTGRLIKKPEKGEVVLIYFYYYDHATYKISAHKKIKNICLETKSFHGGWWGSNQGEAIVTKTDYPDFELFGEDSSGGGEYNLQIIFDDDECIEDTVGNKDRWIEEISRYLTEKGVLSFQFADKKLKANKEVVLSTIKYDKRAFEYADKKLKGDKEVVLAAIKQDGQALEYANEKLKADKEFVLTAVKQAGYALEYADKKLRADKKIVLAAVEQNGSALEYANEKLKTDKEIVLEAVKQYGPALEHADSSLKKDKEFMLEAVKQDGYALQHVDEKLKADKEVVLAAVKQDGYTLQYVDKKLRADKKIVLAAVKQNGSALDYADEKLKGDKEVVLAAVKQDGSALKYVDDSLKNDPDILAIVNKDK